MSREIPNLCEENFTVCLIADYRTEPILLKKLMNELFSKSETGILNLALLKYATPIVEDLIKEISASDEFLSVNCQRLNIYQPSKLDIYTILEEAKLNEAEDSIIILGAERLSQINSAPVMKKNFGELKINLHTQDHIDIETGIKTVVKMNSLIKNSISNLVAVFETTSKMAEDILMKHEKDNDIEINIMIPTKIDSIHVDLNGMLNTINTIPLSESLIFIDSQENLSIENKNILKFTSYLKSGYKEEALKILMEDYNSLNNSMKLIYADLLNSRNQYAESYQILKELFVADKWLPGLLRSLVTSSRFLDAVERKNLIENILKMKVPDLFLLQECANFYNEIKEYNISSKLFREIYSLTGDKYFELVARIAEIQNDPPKNGHDAEGYILAVTVEEPNLQNEAYYRCALLWKFLYDSIYKFTENLFKITLSHEFNKSYEVIKEKMNILADYHNVEKGLKLKPFSKERDNEILLAKRVDLIIDEIEFLFLKDNGHNLLRGFVDDIQSKEAWKVSIIKKLRKEIANWNSEDLEDIKESLDTYTEEDLYKTNSINALRLIRKFKATSVQSMDEIISTINGSLILAKQENNMKNEFLIRFEAASWFSYLGYYQDANNHALTLLNHYNRLTIDDTLKDLSFGLGIIAWGDSQYRLGREIEGVICAIAAIKRGLYLKNYYLIDKGLTIIHLWISNNNIFSLKDGEKFNDFYERFSKIGRDDHGIIEVQGLMMKKEWGKAHTILKPLVLVNEKDENEVWVIHFSNYISVCIKNGYREEAVALLYNKAKKAAKLLETRMDIRWKTILMWSQILMSREEGQYNLLDILLLNKELLKIAIDDIEQQRSSVFHREERATLSDETSLLFRTYVETITILYKLKETPEIIKKDLEKEAILNLIKIAPRTITEKKLFEEEVSEGTKKKFNEYLRLYDELMRAEADLESNEYLEKNRRFSLLQNNLKEIHPHLKPLPVIRIDDLSLIQENLRESEIFYQYCTTPMGMVYLLLTNKEKKIGHVFFDSQKLKKRANQLGEIFSQSEDIKIVKEVEVLCNNISEPIFHPILTQKYYEKISNLFICPDMSIPYFSTSLIRDNSDWLINSLDGIYNLLSITNLLDRSKNEEEKKSSSNILTIGSRLPKRDGAIPIAEQWEKENKKYFIEVINEFGENNQLLINILKKEKPNLYAIIAHGVEEPTISGYNGAFSILGPNKRYLSNNDIEDMSLHTKNIFLITCRSGQPYSDNIQSSNGVWTSMVSQKNNSILCRWDVDIRPSLIILEHIVSGDEKPLCHLLCDAQKKLLKSKDWNAPSLWAGYEYWGV